MVDGVGGFNVRTTFDGLLKSSKMKGGRIDAETWNTFAKAHGWREIKHFINTADAIRSLNELKQMEDLKASVKFEPPTAPSLVEQEEPIDLSKVNSGEAFVLEGNDEVGGAVLKAKEEIAARPEPDPLAEQRAQVKKQNANRQFTNWLNDLVANNNQGSDIKGQLLRGKMDELIKAGVPLEQIKEMVAKSAPDLVAAMENYKPDDGTEAVYAQKSSSLGGFPTPPAGEEQDRISLEELQASNGAIGSFTVEGNDEVGGAVLKAKEEIAAPHVESNETKPLFIPQRFLEHVNSQMTNTDMEKDYKAFNDAMARLEKEGYTPDQCKQFMPEDMADLYERYLQNNELAQN